MKKILLILMFVFISISLIAATEENLGTFKLDSCVNLKQTCGNCTYVNISSIDYPNSNIISSNINMQKDGTLYNHTFCNTNLIGEYVVNTFGDPNGVVTVAPYKFEITPSGFNNTLGLYLVFLIVLITIIVLGFSIKEVWFVVIGGLGLIMLGIYSINSGIVGFRDMFMTWGIGIFQIAVGAILSIGAAWQKIDYD